MNALVSIIIPVYNVSEYIEKCLISCIEQTYSLLEIIVVNDGSTDNSINIVNKYLVKDSRITIVDKNNEGLLWARKKGISVAKGEYIFHLDGDDYLERNAIEILVDCAEKYNADIVIGDTYFDKIGGEIVIEKSPFTLSLYDSSSFLSVIINYAWTVWGRLIKKTLYENVCFFQQHKEDCSVKGLPFGEDALQMLQLGKAAQVICHVNDTIYHYVQRPNSIMNIKNKQIDALRKLEFSQTIGELLTTYKWESEIFMSGNWAVMNSLCYYLKVTGSFGKEKKWIRSYIKKSLFRNSSLSNNAWRKNKKIYLMLICGYFSPSFVKKISTLFDFVRNV